MSLFYNINNKITTKIKDTTMKKSLLIGLAAVTLGCMTACSNILEEEGTISAKTGKLIISLETDDAVNIVTKTENKETVTFEVKLEKDSPTIVIIELVKSQTIFALAVTPFAATVVVQVPEK